MTDITKKIIFSPQISKVFNEHNWIINTDPKSRFHSYFVGDIADYYLNVYYDNGKINFEFTLGLEIPDNKINELLILINIANQNSKEGFFIFDFKVKKIKYNLIKSHFLIIEERSLSEFLNTKLNLISSLFNNFVSGFHHIVYEEKIEGASLELLFLNNEGCA